MSAPRTMAAAMRDCGLTDIAVDHDTLDGLVGRATNMTHARMTTDTLSSRFQVSTAPDADEPCAWVYVAPRERS